jgi:hypothetical protein
MPNIIEFDKPTDDGGFTPLPEGVYDIQVLDGKQTTSKQQNPQIELQCEIAHGEFTGRKFRLWYSLLPQAAWKLRDMLDAIGVEYTEHDGKLRFDLDEVIGGFIRATATPGEYQGKPKNDWTKEEPSPLSNKAPAPADAAPAPAAAPAAAAKPAAAFAPRTGRSR